MGAFGIFAAILTFIYVIYYAVMISMDLFGSKSQQKDNVEVIATSSNFGNEREAVDEQPTFVAEEGMPGIEAKEETPDNEMEDQPETGISNEEIASSDENELYKKALAAKENEMEDVEIHSHTEYTTDEYQVNLDRLMREQEAHAAELS